MNRRTFAQKIARDLCVGVAVTTPLNRFYQGHWRATLSD